MEKASQLPRDVMTSAKTAPSTYKQALMNDDAWEHKRISTLIN